MFIPIDIPSKYFPVVLYGLFSLFAGPDLSQAVGLLVGFLYQNGNLDSFKPSQMLAEQAESSGLLRVFSTGSGWIRSGSAIGYSAVPPSQDNFGGRGQAQRQSDGGGSVYVPAAQRGGGVVGVDSPRPVRINDDEIT